MKTFLSIMHAIRSGNRPKAQTGKLLPAVGFVPQHCQVYKSATHCPPHSSTAARHLQKGLFCLAAGLLLQACSGNGSTDREVPGATRMPARWHTADSTPSVSLDALLKPVNRYVLTQLPVTTLQSSEQRIAVPAIGTVEYDYRQAGSIAANVAGRIEKLYVRYRYQYIHKGQKVMDIYSPELLTSQQNYLFLLQNDASNASLLEAARQRLLLLGMSTNQLDHIAATGRPLYSVGVYSKYAGYVTGAVPTAMPAKLPGSGTMVGDNGVPLTTEELDLKEGTYVEAGQTVLTVVNTNTAIVALSIDPAQQSLVQVGDTVVIDAETAAGKIRTTLAYIEPFYAGDTRTLQARAYISNVGVKIPIGTPVQATIFADAQQAFWLPAGAVLSLGLGSAVFKKEGQLFKAHAVTTGIRVGDKVQILSGLSVADTVAANAQYLAENESFIQVTE